MLLKISIVSLIAVNTVFIVLMKTAVVVSDTLSNTASVIAIFGTLTVAIVALATFTLSLMTRRDVQKAKADQEHAALLQQAIKTNIEEAVRAAMSAGMSADRAAAIAESTKYDLVEVKAGIDGRLTQFTAELTKRLQAEARAEAAEVLAKTQSDQSDKDKLVAQATAVLATQTARDIVAATELQRAKEAPAEPPKGTTP